MKKRRIVITSALPYANGDIHLGHLVEHLTTDYWSRFQKMRGHECLAFCADDTHGAPVMVSARKKGITPEAMIQETQKRHEQDFQEFQVHYDHYSSTHSPTNRKLCDEIFQKILNNNYIEKQQVTQQYCSHDKMFLPDRFVKGSCPKCKAQNQYGDSCDSCSSVYNATELIDPRCNICEKTPEPKDSEHYFFKLENFRSYLKEWLPGKVHSSVEKKLNEWLNEPLRDWCLTRDKPYFGFELPMAPGKFYYVWFDAPIGYIATTQEWCSQNNRQLSEFWEDPNTEIHHNIGKDIIYFHTLFWPAMLKNAGFSAPSKVYVHGMLTFNGEKLSKSKGTFINARTYLKHLDPEYYRYYIACKVGSTPDDIDLSEEDFTSRVNSDLIGKITNIASRGFQMIEKHLDGKLGSIEEIDKNLLHQAQNRGEIIAEFYENREFSKAMLEIREIASVANKLFDEYTPWKLIKTDPERTRSMLTTALNLFRLITIYIKPVIPAYADRVAKLFDEPSYSWDDSLKILENSTVQPFAHLLKRVEAKQMKKVIEEEQKVHGTTKVEAKKAPAKKAEAPKEQVVTIDEFFKVDLRCAKVTQAAYVEGSDKLLSLTLDVGELGQKHVFAGIKSVYKPEELNGSLVTLVSNLKPRKMKFGLSEGMVLCTGEGDQVALVRPDPKALPGLRIS